mgnify:CR=1 FL=1
MSKTLYLMRHAQTMFNVQKKIQGWCDSPLTQQGKEQAKKVSEYLKNMAYLLTMPIVLQVSVAVIP